MSTPNTNIGKVVMQGKLPVEKGKIREFARALHCMNPIYQSLESARASGFDDVPAPPTFTAVAAHYAQVANSAEGTMSPARAAAEALGLEISRTVNGEQSWEFVRVPHAGDELTGTSVITDVQHKVGRRGGESTHVTVCTSYVDQRGDPVVRETVTIIELAGLSSE